MVLLAAPDFEFGRYADTLVNVFWPWEAESKVKG